MSGSAPPRPSSSGIADHAATGAAGAGAGSADGAAGGGSSIMQRALVAADCSFAHCCASADGGGASSWYVTAGAFAGFGATRRSAAYVTFRSYSSERRNCSTSACRLAFAAARSRSFRSRWNLSSCTRCSCRL